MGKQRNDSSQFGITDASKHFCTVEISDGEPIISYVAQKYFRQIQDVHTVHVLEWTVCETVRN